MDIQLISLSVAMFTIIVLILVAIIMFAKSKLVLRVMWKS